tara:strand:+ start:315 stop:566 length:252 start_codon:yes stop_codon:yes gene_type:complete
VLDIRDNEGVTELPPELVRDTPLQNLMVGPALVGGDGQLVEMEGRDSTLRQPLNSARLRLLRLLRLRAPSGERLSLEAASHSL